MRHKTGQSMIEYLVMAGAIMAVILSLGARMNARAGALITRVGQQMTSPSARADGLMP